MTSRSASDRPTFSLPPMMAMVAGTAPSARTTASTFAAKSRFSGQGIPWLRMVLSSATTGAPASSASRTSGFMSRYSFIFYPPEYYLAVKSTCSITWMRGTSGRAALVFA